MQGFHGVDQADGFAADAVHLALHDADKHRFFLADLTVKQGAGLLNSPDHTPVSLDQAVKAHFLTQQILQDRLGAQGGGGHVKVDGGGIVGHDGSNVHFQRCVVGLQVVLKGFLVGHDGGHVNAVHLGAGTREMLHAGDDGIFAQTVLAVLEADDLCHDHLGDQLGVLAEGLHDAAPAGLGGDVRLRGQGHAGADGDVLLTGDVRQLGNQLHIAGGGQTQVMGRDRRAVNIGGAVHRVHGDDDRYTQAGGLGPLLHLIHGLGGVLNAVQLTNQHQADILVRCPLFEVGGHLTVCLGHKGGMLHLGDLLAHSHLGDQVLGAGFRIHTPVLVHVEAAVPVVILELQSVHLEDGQTFNVGQLVLGLGAFDHDVVVQTRRFGGGHGRQRGDGQHRRCCE